MIYFMNVSNFVIHPVHMKESSTNSYLYPADHFLHELCLYDTYYIFIMSYRENVYLRSVPVAKNGVCK